MSSALPDESGSGPAPAGEAGEPYVEVRAQGWAGWLGRRIRVLERCGDLVRILVPDEEPVEVAGSEIRTVEIHASQDPSGKRVFRVEAVLPTREVLLAAGLRRLEARTLAERVARTLSKTLRDFSGLAMTTRRPQDLDRVLVGTREEPGPVDPAWGLEVGASGDRLDVSWSRPASREAALGLLVASLAAMAGTWVVSAVALAWAAAAASRRMRLRADPAGVEFTVSYLGLPRTTRIPRDQLEGLQVENDGSPLLVMVSDRELIALRLPEECIRWLARAVSRAISRPDSDSLR